MGVLVCFGGEIHHARGVRKTDTVSLVAFSSPQTGPLGRVTEGHPIIWSRFPRNPPLDPPSLDRSVLVVPTAAGDDGTLVEQRSEPTRTGWSSARSAPGTWRRPRSSCGPRQPSAFRSSPTAVPSVA